MLIYLLSMGDTLVNSCTITISLERSKGEKCSRIFFIHRFVHYEISVQNALPSTWLRERTASTNIKYMDKNVKLIIKLDLIAFYHFCGSGGGSGMALHVNATNRRHWMHQHEPNAMWNGAHDSWRYSRTHVIERRIGAACQVAVGMWHPMRCILNTMFHE